MGTNNAVSMTSRDILNKLSQLELFTMESNKNCKMIISQLTLLNNNGKGVLTIHQLCELFGELNMGIANKRNIVKHNREFLSNQ